MLFKKVLLEFFFSYQTCSALFSQKKRLSFDFCIFAKLFCSSKWLRWVKKINKMKIKVLCTFHLSVVVCLSLHSSSTLQADSWWQLAV